MAAFTDPADAMRAAGLHFPFYLPVDYALRALFHRRSMEDLTFQTLHALPRSLTGFCVCDTLAMLFGYDAREGSAGYCLETQLTPTQLECLLTLPQYDAAA